MEGPAPVSERTAAASEQETGAGSRLPDLTYTEQENELRAAVRSVLEDRAAPAAVLARTESGQTTDPDLWKTLAAGIGCAGLLVPEELGGAGASYREAAVVAEETGRAIAPVPFLGSAVLATTALLDVWRGGEPGQDTAAGLLSNLAAGTTTAALAVPFSSRPGPRPELTVRVGPPAEGDADGMYRLSGPVRGVADALLADVLLVPADGVPHGLFVVAADEAGLSTTPVVSLDMTRQLADLNLDNVLARRIAAGPEAELAVAAALRAGAGVLACEQLGLAERALEITLAYVKQRYQFARPVGSFQAIKHRLADWWVAVTQARAAARYAVACLADGDPDADVAVALAKAACSDTAVLAGQEMIQLHGGIGFTWEHPAHLYLKRAKSTSLGLGTADRHRASLAGLADLPAP
ncbi:MAG TPA: acyl-CoA dehydrogenase family protein [Streptosporangiaceae bacterium]